MINVQAALERSTLFHDLDAGALAHIAEQFSEKTFQPGETVFRNGDAGNEFYIVAQGEVSLFKRMGLGQRKVRMFSCGDHFGEMALISKATRNGTVRAETEVVCLVLGEVGFYTLLDTEPRFSQRMLQTVTERLRQSDEAASRDMVAAHQALSFSLANLADSRDPETGAHLSRVRSYSQLLAQLLAEDSCYAEEISESFIENIYQAAPLHDICKVAIPDGVLLKQGRLTDAEFEIMAQHTVLGASALERVLEYCDFELFHMAHRVILSHHEQWDGRGYPHGISGTDIPLEARIMTVADIYDALLSERVYKPAFTYEDTLALMQENSGKHFDPAILEVFLAHIDQFEAIHRDFVNQEESMR